MPRPMKGQVVVGLPAPMLAEMERMAAEREMTVSALVSELVYLGMKSLQGGSTLEELAQRRSAPEHHTLVR